jgi:SAM-dependent methyltransferase
VTGKSLLHLQCHFGLDSLSWAKRGAHVTGIDFSEEAINVALELSKELELNARFVCSGVYDLPNMLQGRFDIVFTSYGVIGWLPDLDQWAGVIDHFLKPGGVFYMAEFHPVIWMFDDDFNFFKYSYFNEGVIEIDQQSTYTDSSQALNMKEYSWNHSISDVINALTKRGFIIKFFNEHNFSPYNCFNRTLEVEKGKYRIKGLEKIIPMVYSIMAVKPE